MYSVLRAATIALLLAAGASPAMADSANLLTNANFAEKTFSFDSSGALRIAPASWTFTDSYDTEPGDTGTYVTAWGAVVRFSGPHYSSNTAKFDQMVAVTPGDNYSFSFTLVDLYDVPISVQLGGATQDWGTGYFAPQSGRTFSDSLDGTTPDGIVRDLSTGYPPFSTHGAAISFTRTGRADSNLLDVAFYVAIDIGAQVNLDSGIELANLVLTDTSASTPASDPAIDVAEPGSLAILSVALLGIAGVARRHQNATC